MKLHVFAVRDRATDQFGTPQFLMARGQAIRMFSDEINRAAEDNQLYKHPEDYDLFELGTWDTESANFECGSRPEQVAIGKDLVVPKN